MAFVVDSLTGEGEGHAVQPREEGGGPATPTPVPTALAPSQHLPWTASLDAHQPLPEASKPPGDHDSFTIRHPEVNWAHCDWGPLY